MCFVLSSFVFNTFVFGVKRETTGCARPFLKMDIRGQSDQVRMIYNFTMTTLNEFIIPLLSFACGILSKNIISQVRLSWGIHNIASGTVKKGYSDCSPRNLHDLTRTEVSKCSIIWLFTLTNLGHHHHYHCNVVIMIIIFSIFDIHVKFIRYKLQFTYKSKLKPISLCQWKCFNLHITSDSSWQNYITQFPMDK